MYFKVYKTVLNHNKLTKKDINVNMLIAKQFINSQKILLPIKKQIRSEEKDNCL